MTSDETERVVKDSMTSPGRYADAFRRAKPTKKPSAIQEKALHEIAKSGGVSLGYTSNPLIYSKSLQYLSSAEKQAIYSLVKGGFLKVLQVGPPSDYVLTVQ